MWCPLPWTHISVKNSGMLRLCSHSQSIQYNEAILERDGKVLYVNQLDGDILNNDVSNLVRKQMLEGKWPDTCKRCKFESESGMNSRDKWETERHKDSFTKQDAIQITNPDGSIKQHIIQDFDIRLGNFCNLRCNMCFPGESSRWYQDYRQIYEEDTFPLDGKRFSLDDTSLFQWFDNQENVNRLLDVSGNLLKIKFGGGEPLIIKRHREFLQGLIDRGYSKNIELEYSINVTTIPPYITDMWNNFKEIHLCCSVDAYGDANDAIRYPSKWNVVEKNLRLIDKLGDNVFPFISTTISILSFEHFMNLQLWVIKQDFNKINKHKKHISHMVNNPKEFSFGMLDERQFYRVFDKLYNQAKGHNKLLTILDKYNNLYYKIALKGNDLKINRDLFTKIYYNLQKNQNQDFSAIFPLAHQSVLEWNNNETN